MHNVTTSTTPDHASNPHPLQRNTDAHGFDTVSVPVHGATGAALLDGPTADMVIAAGLSFTGWHLHPNGSVCAASRNPERFPVLVVARLIVGASPGQRVVYRNGNRLDLSRLNLRAALRMASGGPSMPRAPR